MGDARRLDRRRTDIPGAIPVNWYAGLVIIVLLGLLSVVYARYENQHKSSTSPPAVQPAIGTTSFSGISFDICGTKQAALPASANSSVVGLYSPGDGVIQISPTKAADAGNNATLARFVKDYEGSAGQPLELTSAQLLYPGVTHLYTNGEACPKGTPDAGQKAYVQMKYFPAVTLNSGTLESSPSAIKLGKSSYVAVAFAPHGAALARDPKVEVAELQSSAAASSQTSTSTTAAPTATTTPTSTTAPSSTSTTAQSTTSTTAPSTTSTTK